MESAVGHAIKVFVAGATGAIGRRLVPMLVAAGHSVTGMTRSEERASWLRQQGAAAVIADALDANAVDTALGAARPDAVINELTDLPAEYDVRRIDYTGTNRVRRDGNRLLLDAALRHGARRYVAQSIAFVYLPQGTW